MTVSIKKDQARSRLKLGDVRLNSENPEASQVIRIIEVVEKMKKGDGAVSAGTNSGRSSRFGNG